ncbi:MAG: hypothetical protein DRJ47_01755 [Thermoprotei archaeon]|nr:MAG: hypothetical protein DRJ47_01755 [Thermoprotei archaeon]
MPRKLRIVLGITGASGVIYGIRLLETLVSFGHEVYVIVSSAALKVMELETEYTMDYIHQLATKVYGQDDLTAPLTSGSFKFDVMVIAPCSMNTLAAIAHGLESNLILRTASVALKEKRKLILVPRETPLSIIHLENMLAVARAGAVVLPASPGFYHKPTKLMDLVDHIVGKILDQLGIEHNLYRRWEGG